MKKIFGLLLTGTLAVSPFLLTGCIEETLPTSGATQEQINESLSAKEALIWGIPAFENSLETATDQHFDWGLGSVMHIRDVMTEDMAVISSNYDHYTAWETNRNLGKEYTYAGFVWIFHTKWVQTANLMVGSVDDESTASPATLGYVGAGYAFRALIYLDMARMFEYLPCDVNKEGKNSDNKIVTYLTVPIVTNETTEEQAKDNPRVDHDTMYKFILADLDKAEAYIPNLSLKDPTLPTLGVVYGLKARLFMWNAGYLEETGADASAEYKKAQDYARLAINEGYSVTTKAEWTDPTTGFNTPVGSWMLCAQAIKENDVVQSGILNWTSWMSNETTYGYAAAGPMSMASKAFYDRISSNDWRKLSWQAPEGSKLRKQNTYVDDSFAEMPEYASLKFRPGQGNFEDYQVGSASAFPLMRVEEMYFIEAEAAAHQNPAQGKKLLEDFMTSYRNSSYSTSATTVADVVEEIVFQKRVELWGEGQSFFDIKRLNYSVTRKYDETNFRDDAQFNTDGRPAWMNFVIVRTEEANNVGVTGWNNPDPSGLY